METRRGDRADASPSPSGQLTDAEASRLRQALLARYGVELGGEAFDAATAWAWEHRDALAAVTNRVGYLYRVGMSATRTHVRWRQRTIHRDVDRLVEAQFPDIDLHRALLRLPDRQRVAVVLVHAHGWPYADVADLLDVTVAAVTNHVHRGLARLRTELGSEEP